MNLALVEAARAYMDAPFKHQGREPFGMDCAGLVALALADTGRPIWRDVLNYGRTPWRNGFEQAVEDNLGDPQPAGTALEPGDIVLMNARPGAPISHIAIVTNYALGGLGLIHTRSDIASGKQKGRVVEHILDADYRSRIVKVFR